MSKWVEFPDREQFETFERPQYLSFLEGFPVIVRVLDKRAYHTRKHWLNRQRTSILCLGESCPICQNNAKIRAENPKSFRNIRGYIPIQNRYVVNVLDRTPVVIDPETGDEYYARQGKFPTVSDDGERSLAKIEPRPVELYLNNFSLCIRKLVSLMMTRVLLAEALLHSILSW